MIPNPCVISLKCNNKNNETLEPEVSCTFINTLISEHTNHSLSLLALIPPLCQFVLILSEEDQQPHVETRDQGNLGSYYCPRDFKSLYTVV